MEMEFKDTERRRRLLLIVVGVLLAAVAGWGAFMLASGGSGGSAQVVTEPVLVAARDIPARQQVTVDDVTIRQVPIDEVLSQSYAAPALVVGRLTAVPVYADQQMTPNLFATNAADAEFAIVGPDEEITLDSPYWRAVAVEVPHNRAVGGEITAGQHVDLLVSVDIRVLTQNPETGEFEEIDTATEDGLMSGKSTKITYQDLQVLKADPDENMYILKVNLQQAEEIAHVVQEAPDSFMIVLRPETDTRPVDTSQLGTTTDRLVMTYLFPAPQLIDLSQLLGAPVTPGSGGAGTPPASPSPAPEESPSPTPEPN
jgi:Flp pilus assembly protein CpaB